jgi:hypothetical protein
MSAALTPLEAASQVIDYDALYRDYLASLVDTLRGFSASVPGLELWVADENPIVSLTNLLDAAASTGRTSISLKLGPTTCAKLDLEELRRAAGQFGTAAVSRRNDGVLLEVRNLSSAHRRAAPARLAPRESDGAPAVIESEVEAQAARDARSYAMYRHALEAQPYPLERALSPAGATGGVLIRAQRESVALELVISTEHAIAAAGYSALEPRTATLLARLCDVVIGLPILEAADHGALRLEHALRERANARPVPGIVTPLAAHSMFELPQQLLRDALADYRRLTGFDSVDNHYDLRPGPAWLRASHDQRVLMLELALSELAPVLGISAGDVRVTSIRYDVRVELGLSPSLPHHDKPQLVMQLERELKARVDPRLEVYVEELRDKNKLRRLAVVEGST